ncbi:hypothetical protein V2J84_18565 [Pseudomonas alliivorans]|nr:hypothetical protein [Pseudomonas alliivorans]MEE5055677.1 hypothetical protein [Pseudomonas alliivorans]
MSADVKRAIFDWLEGPSLVAEGLDAALPDAIMLVRDRFPDRSFCVVKEWCWLEFSASATIKQGLAAQGELPALLLASGILHDSLNRFRPGRGVRTSFLAERVEGPFFVTKNTVYVLLGQGRRKRAEFDSLSLLF